MNLKAVTVPFFPYLLCISGQRIRAAFSISPGPVLIFGLLSIYSSASVGEGLLFYRTNSFDWEMGFLFPSRVESEL